MKTNQESTPETASPTRIEFDLAKVLTPEELVKFTAAAKDAEAESLTDHFLNITLRVKEGRAA